MCVRVNGIIFHLSKSSIPPANTLCHLCFDFCPHRDSGNVGTFDQIPPYPPSIPPYFLPSSSAITAVERDGWRSPPGSLQGVAGLSNAQVSDFELHLFDTLDVATTYSP